MARVSTVSNRQVDPRLVIAVVALIAVGFYLLVSFSFVSKISNVFPSLPTGFRALPSSS